MSSPVCAVCNVPAVQLCAGCKNVYYCNREHQKKHWKEGHKNNCAPYKILNDASGPILIAARDIKQNEVILKEIPVIVGPHSKTYIVCLGCNKNIEDEENIYRCESCKWPLCGKTCENGIFHKTECKLMSEKGFTANFTIIEGQKYEEYGLITPLRALILKSTSKTKFETLTVLLNRKEQSLEYDNKNRDKLKTNVVPFIKEVLNLDFTEDEIIEASCLFDLNSTEIVKSNLNIRGLYPTASLIRHTCVSNTKYTINANNLQLTLIATTSISKGDPITISHCEILWGTLARRSHLKETKYIDCKCKRCSDKTELGTYLGAIFCARCKKPNEETCPKILSTDPLNSTAIWKCEKCDHTIRGRQMIWGNDAIKSEMQRLGKDPLSLEQFLVKYKDTLHAKNYHALVAKYALSQIYGNVKGYFMSELTDTILERKIDICHELLEVCDELAPGFSTIRGSLLYDLQSAMVVQTKQELNNGKITKAAAQETLMECTVLLKEATEILSSEPEMKEFLQEKLQELLKELDF